jgi:hypothetical protein
MVWSIESQDKGQIKNRRASGLRRIQTQSPVLTTRIFAPRTAWERGLASVAISPKNEPIVPYFRWLRGAVKSGVTPLGYIPDT